MSHTLSQFDAIINRCRALFVDKMKDYGSAWRILRMPSITDQIYIKAKRIRSIQEKGEQKINEDEVSEFIGIINYAVMGLIQFSKGIAEQPDLNQKQAIQLYDQQISKTLQLMQDKNHDYGEAWRDIRVVSMTDLIIQKLLRVKQIEANQGKTMVSEGIDANYRDIINYAVFSIITIQENR